MTTIQGQILITNVMAHVHCGVYSRCDIGHQKPHLCKLTASSSVKKVTACPCLPARPVRPGSHDNSYQDNPCQPSVVTHISGTYSVDVADGGGWEVIVDDHVDSLEVNPSTHQISTDQYPDLKEKTLL